MYIFSFRQKDKILLCNSVDGGGEQERTKVDEMRDVIWWMMPWGTLESGKLYSELLFYHALCLNLGKLQFL